MGQGEAQQGHGGDHDAGHDQVDGVEESAASDQDGEGDVHVGFRAARVRLHRLHSGHACNTAHGATPRATVVIVDNTWCGSLESKCTDRVTVLATTLYSQVPIES